MTKDDQINSPYTDKVEGEQICELCPECWQVCKSCDGNGTFDRELPAKIKENKDRIYADIFGDIFSLKISEYEKQLMSWNVGIGLFYQYLDGVKKDCYNKEIIRILKNIKHVMQEKVYLSADLYTENTTEYKKSLTRIIDIMEEDLITCYNELTRKAINPNYETVAEYMLFI